MKKALKEAATSLFLLVYPGEEPTTRQLVWFYAALLFGLAMVALWNY
ncbi:hypothetical protein I5M27_12905 [Adhaeribacter sp. BT258]|uniref:Uncharacterized protein n=1 Tax=Adhaeribacter terrigena TaxID=2793070 RepID=A0ABS1C3B3_9BACT|nr:hypothetical protein [Adhaeribacter terrigena]MBK0403887.1 hypothetical protein [Adhaeribacter terrigena]